MAVKSVNDKSLGNVIAYTLLGLTLPMVRRGVHVLCPATPSSLSCLFIVMRCVLCGECVTRRKIVYRDLDALSVNVVHCAVV